jgi:hypothetical protein
MTFIKRTLAVILTIVSIQIDAGSSLTSAVDFYGHPLILTYDQQLSQVKFYKYDQREIERQLSYYRNSVLKNAAYGVLKHAENYKLDDAAITLLVDKYAENVAKEKNSNKQVFIKYLMLKELEYDVLLTKTGNTLNCMGHLAFTPGRYIFIQYNNKSYKDLNFKNRKNKGKHTIYGDSKQTNKRIGHNIKATPSINAKKRSKLVSFTFGVEKHKLTAESNQSVVEFLADLPMYEVGIEFTSLHMSNEMEATVVEYLRAQVADRETVDQVRFLLAFVQQVVPYGSDYTKYGEERFYYPEETIMASNADCEDKAMLLAYLTKEILGFKSVGLFFQKDEHLSLGIEIPGYEPTGSFGYNGKRYVSCEPTAKYPRLTQSQFSLERVDQVIEL